MHVDLLGTHAIFAALIAVTWGLAALVTWRSSLFAAAYAAATVAISLGVAFVAAAQPWPAPALADLRHLQWQIISLGVWCSLSVAVLRFTRRSPGWSELWRDVTPLAERVILSGLIVALLVLGTIGCVPGVLVELGFVSPQSEMATSAWHGQAIHVESWFALAAVVLPLIAILVRQLTPWGVLALTAVTALVPLLLAGRHEPEIAVASACRWGFAIYGLVWALLLAGRRKLELVWQSLQSSTMASVSDRCRELGPLTVTFAAFVVGCPDVSGRRPIDSGKPLERPDRDILIRETWRPLTSYSIPLAADVGGHVDCRRTRRQSGDGGRRFTEHRLSHGHPCQLRLRKWTATPQQTFDWGVAMLQWMSIALGIYGLVWLGLGRWIDRHAADRAAPVSHGAPGGAGCRCHLVGDLGVVDSVREPSRGRGAVW